MFSDEPLVGLEVDQVRKSMYNETHLEYIECVHTVIIIDIPTRLPINYHQ